MKNKNKIKSNASDVIYVWVISVILILFSIAALYPFLNVVAISLSDKEYVAKGAISVFPKGFNIDAYKSVLSSKTIFIGYKNSIIVTVLTTVFGIILTAMTAYPLSKSKLPGCKYFLIIVSVTIWFYGGMIPSFLVMRELNLLDSLFGLSIANALAGYNIIVMRSFFMSIPDSLEESAMLDGCNDIQVLFKVILPLSLPSIATIGLWIAVAAWNDFLRPMLWLSSTSKYTLQIFLRDIIINSNIEASDIESGVATSDMIKYATIIVATVPVLCVYLIFNKYFVKGLASGAVKG